MGHARLAVLIFLSLSTTTHKLPFPVDIQRYGCSITQRAGSPYHSTYVWALLPGDDVDCPREINQFLETGRAVSGQCYTEQLSIQDSRKKAMSDCSHWMDDVKEEILKAKKKSKK